MSAWEVQEEPVAVRVRNGHYDGMITGYLHGGVQFTKADPGNYQSASFVVNQRMGYRSDMIQPYTRVYFYNKRNGETIWEGDVTHPGMSWSADGALMQVQVDGCMERLNDWSDARIYIDSSFEGWEKVTTSITSTELIAGDDRGGSGDQALTLAFPMNTHVDANYRIEAIYLRLDAAGQQIGLIDYSWDAGLTNASWLIRGIVSPGAVVVRTNTANTAGGASSLAYVGPSWTAPKDIVYLQLLWNSGPSSTGNVSDVVWASIMQLRIVAYLWLKDGTRRAGVDHATYVDAPMVIQDLLGDAGILFNTFDSLNARIDVGDGVQLDQFVFVDGTTAKGVLDEWMKFETTCTYLCGASSRTSDKFSFKWVQRSNTPRYEAYTWIDEHSTGNQPTEQYNRAVTRWKDRNGRTQATVSTLAVPEMDAVGRVRTFYQDLSNVSGSLSNVTIANTQALFTHQTPKNGGTITITRPIVDLATGRTVQPYEIEIGELVRVSGVDPNPAALNFSVDTDGVRIFRIVAMSYDSETHSAELTLDTEVVSLMAAVTDQQNVQIQRKG